jgi:phage shock protein PspC (stress-responsive transcriptional regulator)
MNKTIQVNLCGQSFTVDDNAYEELSAYISDLKRFYADEEGLDEIIADIEARFAEVFSQKLEKEGRQIVSIADVQTVINAMGRPEDFESAQDAQPGPKLTSKGFGGKRMYRDPDNKILAGVSSGLASYFGVNDPVWIRILFILLAWFGGGGLLIYIILWFIMPEAKTTSQKLEMRGEPVNLSNLEKSIKEEVTGAGNHLKSFVTGRDTQSALNRGVNLIGEITGKIIAVLVIILKGFLYFIGAILLFCAAVTLLALLAATIIGMPIASLIFFEGTLQSTIAMVGLLLFVAVPLIILLYLPIRLFFNKRIKSNIIGLSLLAAWIVGLLMVVFASLSGVSLMAREHQSKHVQTMAKPDTLYLAMNSLGETVDFESINLGDLKYLKNKDLWVLGNVELDIVQSTDSQQVEIVQYNSARGNDREKAKVFSEGILYDIQIDGDTIRFDDALKFGEPRKFRNQKVRITLKIPENTMVIFGPQVERIINNIPLSSRIGAYNDNTVYHMQDGMLHPVGVSATAISLDDIDMSLYNMQPYDLLEEIDAKGAMNIKIIHGDEAQLYIHQQVAKDIKVKHNMGALQLTREKANVKITTGRISAHTYDCIIVTPALTDLQLSGYLKARMEGFTNADLKAKLSGMIELNLTGEWDDLDLDVTGNSKVIAQGSSTTLNLELGGASRLIGDRFKASTAAVNISGASKANLEVISLLMGEVSGASTLEYAGEPKIDLNTTGASKLKKSGV